MALTLKQTIYKRKSIRSYEATPVDQQTLLSIQDFAENKLKQLDDENPLKTVARLTTATSIKSMARWKAPHYYVLFADTSDSDYEMKLGFMYQQLDLYIQSLGVGTCWLGSAKLAPGFCGEDGLKYYITLAFGKAKGEMYRFTDDFKRKERKAISDVVDSRLEPARLAPSANNGQPWYFLHDGKFMDVYSSGAGLMSKVTGDFSNFDIGCALAHMYVDNPETFRWVKIKEPKSVKGHKYMGTFRM